MEKTSKEKQQDIYKKIQGSGKPSLNEHIGIADKYFSLVAKLTKLEKESGSINTINSIREEIEKTKKIAKTMGVKFSFNDSEEKKEDDFSGFGVKKTVEINLPKKRKGYMGG